MDAIPYFSINSSNWNKLKTFISRNAKKGYLASNIVYISIAHKSKLIDQYLQELDTIFKIISNIENNETSIDEYLETPEAHSGFARLN